MKLIFLALTALIVISGFSQLDYVHWLPPMHSRDAGQIDDHYLYLSTPHPTPITVTITDGAGTVLASPEISAGSPFVYTIATNDPSVVMVQSNDLNEVLTNKGIIASSTEKFYCNFRARSNYHATSITCKGEAARGTAFRIAAMPQQFEQYMRDFTFGIMATEDGTNITINEYDTGVEFFDTDGNITLDELTISLDSGECYVAAGYLDVAANLDGIVGALIESDKPIVLNNGSWCGSIAPSGNQDIGMDQSVPVDILGDEYILIRGDGDAAMERPLVIAHHDGTEIFVNGDIVPIASIDAGEYFLIPESYYVGAGHENMFVKTSQPAYMYQPLGGSADRATPGMNFIPPVSCTLTNEIDMIPGIDKIGGTTYNGAIICFTLAGATVTVNGIPQGGAEPVTGAPGWETYKITGFTGDVKVESTDRMAAGMFGYSGYAGFAGFYSGFDQIGFVDFTYTGEGCEGVEVEFEDETITLAEEIMEWHWDFGDGETSEDEDPTHVYAEGGTYEASLAVETNLGCLDTVHYTIAIGDIPSIDFSPDNGCLIDSIAFVNETVFDEGTIAAWTWEFGDGLEDDVEHPTHLFPSAGTYAVTLTGVTDMGCSATATHSVEIYPNPEIDFSTGDNCIYEISEFENLSSIAEGTIAEFNWEFGDGAISELIEPTHSYAVHGDYFVRLEAISDLGCSADSTITVHKFAMPTASFTVPDPACLNETIDLTNTSTIDAPFAIASYAWSLGDGFTSDLESPSHDYLTFGAYDISLSVISDEGCADDTTVTLDIFDQPIASFITATENCLYEEQLFTNASIILDGAITEYNWDFGDGEISDEESPTHLYDLAATYAISLTVVSDHGCSDDTTITIVKNPIPLASFETTGFICSDETSVFTNMSEVDAPGLITTYAWDFGDGETAAIESPTHDYASFGTYSVNLTVTTADGCSDDTTLTIFTVYDAPHAAFNVTDNCIYDETVFENLSTVEEGVIESYQWNFGDDLESADFEPIHAYETHGIYEVHLMVETENGCTDDTTITLSKFAAPEAIFETTDHCLNLESTFLNSSTIDAPYSIESYDWNFGDGSTSPEINPTHIYLAPGTFDVTLKVISEEGCADSINVALSIFDQPVASFIAEDGCENLPFIIENTSTITLGEIVTFAWNYGDGTAEETATPAHEYEGPGLYPIHLSVVSDHGCTADTTITIERFAAPVADFEAENTCQAEAVFCDNASSIEPPYTIASYLWEFGGDDVSEIEDPSYSYPTFGTKAILLTVTSENGCSTSMTKSIEVYAMPVVSFSPVVVCSNGDPTVFDNETTIASGDELFWLWTLPSDSITAVEAPIYNFNTEGTYDIELVATSEFGCADSLTQSVVVMGAPIADFVISDTTICQFECVDASSLSFSLGSSIDSYEWSTTYGHTGNDENLDFCFDMAGSSAESYDIQLVVVDVFGCSDTMIKENYITVIPAPEASFYASKEKLTLLDTEVAFTNTSINANAYVWNFGDFSDNTTEENPIHEFDNTVGRTYQVTLYAYNDDRTCSDTAKQIITIEDELIYFVPNAFTPDGDNLNNIFKPIFAAGHDPYNYHLSIFNRWGEIIFESYNAEVGWDGTLRQDLVQDGVYVWSIEFKERASGKLIKEQGHVTLLQ